MLKTFTAALLATALIAGPAFAAGNTESAAPAGTAAAPAVTTPANTATTATPAKKPVRHARVQSRKHVVHHAAKAGKVIGKVSKTGKVSKKSPA
jgi:hypothetical protein